MPSNLVGRKIADRYQIDAFVGAGAMGEVYRARQLALGTTVAIKVMHPHLAKEPTFAARFLREAKAASRIDHPSSIRVLDFGEDDGGLFYMVMEMLEGTTLDAVLEKEGTLPVARIVRIASQVLAALAVAHDKGVIHRDLKPANIMLLDGDDDDGEVVRDRVKVCDFGVARLMDAHGERSVTAEGLVIGTPEYMSPEQARGESLDARSDIYAMGVLLFQLMTGSVPFDSETPLGTALMHVNDEPTRPTILNPRVDARLEEICLKAMKKRPEERYATARDLRVALLGLLGEDASPVSGLRAQLAPRRQRLGWAVWAVGLGALAVSGSVILRDHDARPPAEAPSGVATLTSGAVAPVTTKAAEPVGAVPAPEPTAAASEPEPAATAEESAPPVRHARKTAQPRPRRPHAPSRAGAAREPADPLAPDAPAPEAKPAAKPEAQPASAPKPEPKAPATKPEGKPAEAPKAEAKPAKEPAPLPDFPVPPSEPPPLP
jgi:eukaryotic-like serine/threonine-protein kinase